MATDEHLIKAVGMGNVQINLPNGTGKIKAQLKDAIYAPNIAFTLISISQLDCDNCSVTFNKGVSMIKHLNGHMMTTVPWTNGLYCVLSSMQVSDINYINVTSVKMGINQAHCKFSHIGHSASKHVISAGMTKCTIC